MRIYFDNNDLIFQHEDGTLAVWFMDVREPPHVHVLHGEKVAKVWLDPVRIQTNRGYNRAELNRVLKLTRGNQTRLLEAWYGYFNR